MSVSASSGTETSGGGLLAPADALGTGMALADGEGGGVEAAWPDSDGEGRPAGGVGELVVAVGPAEPGAGPPASGAATAARTAASSSWVAIALAAASICCCDGAEALSDGMADGVDVGLGAAGVGVGVGLLAGAVDGEVAEKGDERAELPAVDRVVGVALVGGVVCVPGVTAGVVSGGVDGGCVARVGAGVGAGTVAGPVFASAVGWLLGDVGVGVGCGVGVEVLAPAVVGAAVSAGSRLLWPVRAPPLGVALGAALEVVVRGKLGSWSPGVLLGLALGAGLLVELPGVPAFAPSAGVSLVSDGLGVTGTAARAAMAARSALATSAVICARACWSCASSSGEPKVLGTGPLGLGVTVTVYGPGVGVGVAAAPVALEGGEAVSPATAGPLSGLAADAVGVGGAPLGSAGIATTSAPGGPTRMVKVPFGPALSCGWSTESAGAAGSTACASTAAAAAGAATTIGPRARNRAGRVRWSRRFCPLCRGVRICLPPTRRGRTSTRGVYHRGQLEADAGISGQYLGKSEGRATAA